ncbi:MAG: N-acetylmuramoyl-L-alanine amidase [Clostridiales Family XIII bacterium]|jgi:N-acetylmuramoyl-L-alanine amidase|nr:N-acetylmuramoyl-L-alanine amidase [Clostridiales Family XIII bacterium]
MKNEHKETKKNGGNLDIAIDRWKSLYETQLLVLAVLPKAVGGFIIKGNRIHKVICLLISLLFVMMMISCGNAGADDATASGTIGRMLAKAIAEVPSPELMLPAPAPEPEPEPEPKTELSTLPLAGLTIGIDAGHQQYGNSEQEPVAPGASETKARVTGGTSGVATGKGEYQLNLEVALKLDAILRERGATTIMVRTQNEVDISNVERATMMNNAGVNLCIRIHANGGDAAQHGAMMLVPSGSVPAEIQSASKTAGEIIFNHFLQETGAVSLGVIPRSDLSGFNWSTVPVCLIEMGFMTNYDEDLLMSTEDYQYRIAKGLADGIESWHNNY